ncbi:hypothetical protein HWV62_38833 [Athelia sp. TMB]|nr:hypothetical protein HWV62_38833 [Athelia sp. TMB]
MFHNTVVFNLWSACLQSNDKSTPNFTHWTQPCAANHTQVTYGDYPMHGALKGVQIPTWAYVNVTSDGHYDSNAVNAKATSGWNTSQILAPVLLGVALLIVFALLLWWYRRYMRKKYGPKRRQHHTQNTRIWAWFKMLRIWPVGASSSMHRSAVVGSEGSTWVIDDFDLDQAHRRSPDSDECSDFGAEALPPGHSFPLISPEPDQPLPQGQHIRPLGKARKNSGTPSWVPFSTSSSSGSSFWRNPFKKHPQKVTFTSARRGFRVDEADLSTSAAESRRPTLVVSSLGHSVAARSEDRERERERERENLRGVGEPVAVEGDGMAEDSVLLISHEHSPDVSHTHGQKASPVSPWDTNAPSPIAAPTPQHQAPPVQLKVIPPSRANTLATNHPARASSPTLPLTALSPIPASPLDSSPAPGSSEHPPSSSSPAPVLRPLPSPPPLPTSDSPTRPFQPPLSSPPSYYSQHPPLHSILIPNHTLNINPMESASPSYSPRSLSPNPIYPGQSQGLSPHSRNISSESVGLIRPARTDPINLIPASVRAAGYNPYVASQTTLLGHSRNPLNGSEATSYNPYASTSQTNIGLSGATLGRDSPYSGEGGKKP